MEHDWASYRLLVQDRQALTVVDLSYFDEAPISVAADLVWLRIPFVVTRPDGLPASDEMPVLDELEASIVDLCADQPTHYVGRCASAGTMDFFLYSPNRYATMSSLSEMMADFPTYSPEIEGRAEPSWSCYLEFLYPSDRERQSIENSRLLESLAKQGDQPEVEREVCHRACFRRAAQRTVYRKKIEAAGYRVTQESDDIEDAERPFALVVAKDQCTDKEAIAETSLQLFDLAVAADGIYEGWETLATRTGPET